MSWRSGTSGNGGDRAGSKASSRRPILIRAPHAGAWTAIAVALAAGALVAAWATAGASGALRLLPLAGGGLLITYVVMAMPSLLVEETGLTVVNPATRVHVPWAALTVVDTRWSLTLVTPHRRVTVWAAPSSGRHRITSATAREVLSVHPRDRGQGGSVRLGELVGTPSGAAAKVVRERWTDLAESNRLDIGIADQVPVEVTRTPWLLLLGTVATVAGLALL